MVHNTEETGHTGVVRALAHAPDWRQEDSLPTPQHEWGWEVLPAAQEAAGGKEAEGGAEEEVQGFARQLQSGLCDLFHILYINIYIYIYIYICLYNS